MSTAGYKRECEEAAADVATKLEITAQAKLKAVEPESWPQSRPSWPQHNSSGKPLSASAD